MKNLYLLMFFILGFTVYSQSQTWVNGYTTSNGTYVSGYYKTVSNETATDNNGYKGNINPYTGEVGSKALYQNTTPTEDRTLYSGSKGGVYYYNSNGNKTYVRTK